MSLLPTEEKFSQFHMENDQFSIHPWNHWGSTLGKWFTLDTKLCLISIHDVANADHTAQQLIIYLLVAAHLVWKDASCYSMDVWFKIVVCVCWHFKKTWLIQYILLGVIQTSLTLQLLGGSLRFIWPKNLMDGIFPLNRGLFGNIHEWYVWYK